MLEIIVGGGLSWYYYNNMENNTYIKNVVIYAVANFLRMIIEQIFAGQKISIISCVIMSFIVGLIDVKIMEFAKKNTNTIWTFMLLSILLMMVVAFVISFMLSFIISAMFIQALM